jgi:cilia- and flagella-associated protein 53
MLHATRPKKERIARGVVTWQALSDQKMEDIATQRRLEALALRRDADLHARRQRLATKLHAEEEAYRSELLASRETPEQRRAKLTGRAKQLAQKREAERQALAAQLTEQAFLESCDVLRETNSKRILYRTLDERSAQVGGSGASHCLFWTVTYGLQRSTSLGESVQISGAPQVPTRARAL